MPYIITDTSGDEIIIPDGGLNQDYTIDLVGRNYENYGSIIAKTQVGLLENFANSTPPKQSLSSSGNHTTGQIWYDTGNKVLRVYDETNASWLPQTPIITSGAPSNTFNQIVNGFMYFNTQLAQLYIYANGSYYRANSAGEVSDAFSGSGPIGNPTEYGTNVRNIFLYDTSGVPRNVFAIVSINNGSGNPNIGNYYQNEQIIAIFSDHEEFTVTDSPQAVVEGTVHAYGAQLAESGGIGLTIKPGINVRKDSTATQNYAKHSDRSEAAYKINTGSFTLSPSTGVISDNGGANISGANIYHRGDSIVSDSHDTYTIGNSTTTFSEGYFTDVYIGDGTQGNILPNGSSDVNIGSSTNEINNIYVSDVIVSGNIEFPAGGSVGDENNYLEKIYVSNVYTNVVNIDGYQLPTAAGTNGQQIYLGVDGTSEWMNPYNTYSSIGSPNNSVDIEFEALNTIQEGSVTLNPTAIKLRSNVDFMHSKFSGSTYISYNGTGKFTLNYPDPFRTGVENNDWNWNPSDFVQVSGNQDVAGVKTFSDQIIANGGIDLNDADIDYTGTLSLTGSEGRVQITSDGAIVADDDITAFSDRRLKENERPITDALSKLTEITGYTYNKKGQHKRSAGVMAQDVLKVLPEVVTEHEDGMLSVAYGNMIALLIEAVKELTEEVNILKAQQQKG